MIGDRRLGDLAGSHGCRRAAGHAAVDASAQLSRRNAGSVKDDNQSQDFLGWAPSDTNSQQLWLRLKRPQRCLESLGDEISAGARTWLGVEVASALGLRDLKRPRRQGTKGA